MVCSSTAVDGSLQPESKKQKVDAAAKTKAAAKPKAVAQPVAPAPENTGFPKDEVKDETPEGMEKKESPQVEEKKTVENQKAPETKFKVADVEYELVVQDGVLSIKALTPLKSNKRLPPGTVVFVSSKGEFHRLTSGAKKTGVPLNWEETTKVKVTVPSGDSKTVKEAVGSMRLGLHVKLLQSSLHSAKHVHLVLCSKRRHWCFCSLGSRKVQRRSS